MQPNTGRDCSQFPQCKQIPVTIALSFNQIPDVIVLTFHNATKYQLCSLSLSTMQPNNGYDCTHFQPNGGRDCSDFPKWYLIPLYAVQPDTSRNSSHMQPNTDHDHSQCRPNSQMWLQCNRIPVVISHFTQCNHIPVIPCSLFQPITGCDLSHFPQRCLPLHVSRCHQ